MVAAAALQYSISDYREKLYLDIVRRKKELKRRNYRDRDARSGASHGLYRPSAADDAPGYAYRNARQP